MMTPKYKVAATYRNELADRLNIALRLAKEAPFLSDLSPSVIAEKAGDSHPLDILHAFDGIFTLDFMRLEKIAHCLGVNPDWLKHGTGSIFRAQEVRLMGEEGFETLCTAEPGYKIRAIHLLRDDDKTGRLSVVKEYEGVAYHEYYKTPHHISEEIGQGGEGQLVGVFDMLERLYRESSILTLGYMVPSNLRDRIYGPDKIHPLALAHASTRSIWWEDVWDKGSLDRNSECWLGQKSLTKRIISSNA